MGDRTCPYHEQSSLFDLDLPGTKCSEQQYSLCNQSNHMLCQVFLNSREGQSLLEKQPFLFD